MPRYVKSVWPQHQPWRHPPHDRALLGALWKNRAWREWKMARACGIAKGWVLVRAARHQRFIAWLHAGGWYGAVRRAQQYASPEEWAEADTVGGVLHAQIAASPEWAALSEKWKGA